MACLFSTPENIPSPTAATTCFQQLTAASCPAVSKRSGIRFGGVRHDSTAATTKTRDWRGVHQQGFRFENTRFSRYSPAPRGSSYSGFWDMAIQVVEMRCYRNQSGGKEWRLGAGRRDGSAVGNDSDVSSDRRPNGKLRSRSCAHAVELRRRCLLLSWLEPVIALGSDQGVATTVAVARGVCREHLASAGLANQVGG